MGNNDGNGQIKEFIANLKNRKAYQEKKAIKLGFPILKTMYLINYQIKSRNLQLFVRLLRSQCGAKIKLKKSRLLLVVAVDISQLSLGSNQIGALN